MNAKARLPSFVFSFFSFFFHVLMKDFYLKSGVVLDSENVHRVAYNETFKNFNVKVNDEASIWDEAYY